MTTPFSHTAASRIAQGCCRQLRHRTGFDQSSKGVKHRTMQRTWIIESHRSQAPRIKDWVTSHFNSVQLSFLFVECGPPCERQNNGPPRCLRPNLENLYICYFTLFTYFIIKLSKIVLEDVILKWGDYYALSVKHNIISSVLASEKREQETQAEVGVIWPAFACFKDGQAPLAKECGGRRL